MKSMIRKIFLLGILLSGGQLAVAQTTDEGDGEVQDAEIVIEKERTIELKQEEKLHEFIRWSPEGLEEVVIPSEFTWYTYDVANEPLNFQPTLAVNQESTNTYQHYGKVGFGNYSSPLLDISLSAVAEAHQMLGASFKHLSFANGEVDHGNSSNAATEAGLYGAIIRDKYKLVSTLNYRFEKNNYYGYPVGTVVDSEDIQHRAGFLSFDLSLLDQVADDVWHYEGSLGFKNYSDNFSAKENTLQTDLKVNYSDQVALDAELIFSKYTDTGIDQSRSLVRLNPYYQLLLGGFKWDVGLSFSIQNDNYPDLSSQKLFPYVNASYPISDQITAIAKLDGGFDFNSIYDQALEVGVLNQAITLVNSERLFDFSGGVVGRLTDQLSFQAIAGYQSVKYLPILINGEADQSRIDIVYDTENSNILTFRGEADYKLNDSHQLSFGLNLYNYTSDGYDQIYHRPSSEILLSGNHVIMPKFRAQWNFAWVNGLVGRDANATDVNVNLDAITKLDLHLHYQINDSWGAFLQAENLIDQNYSQYLFYPQRGLQIKVGANFRL